MYRSAILLLTTMSVFIKKNITIYNGIYFKSNGPSLKLYPTNFRKLFQLVFDILLMKAR